MEVRNSALSVNDQGVGTIRLNDGKAGMQGLDKEAINKVILEASRGTPYFAFQEKRQASIDSKVKQLKEALSKLTQGERKSALQKMDALGEVLEAQRDLSHNIVHIDMDAFYAAVEMLDNPDLKGKPMAVGSSSMLSTSNYEARRFGVRAAMPGFIGKKLCPQLIVVPCHFKRYKEVSNKVVEVVLHYDPNLCSASLDEMYLDLTDYVKKEHKRRIHHQNCGKGSCNNSNMEGGSASEIFSIQSDKCLTKSPDSKHLNENCKKRKLSVCGSDSDDSSVVDYDSHTGHLKKLKQADNPVNSQENSVIESWLACTSCCVPITREERDRLAYDIVNEIREKIFKATGLTASAGIAPNVMLAKVCSDQNKPNGQFQLKSTVEDVKSFVSSLAVKKINGIGPVQGQILNALGLNTCLDLWSQRDIVSCLFSPISVDFYMRASKGIGRTTIKSEYVRKSIGTERTFQEINDREELHKKCEELCVDAVEDLQMHNMVGKVVVLKLKTTKFKTHTRNQSLTCYTADKDIILGAAKRLLDLEMAAVAPEPLRLRLMGIRIANLVYEDSIGSTERHTVKIKDFLKRLPESSKSPPFSLIRTNETDVVKIEKIDTLPEEEKSEYLCPVCNVRQRSKDLEDFNSHIDNCLNRSTIKEILAEDTHSMKKVKYENQSSKKIKLLKHNRTERKIDDYFL
ncbi:hypothetical protein JTE90_023115 [Oedothorax gibbosus]|uniref:DNA polymerase kappa n=1 Tax=Oedothorax gibbosus TaxID=931172 RepID=A0AAV6UMI8_9ARAC|nr:hypothetical protein JTE90_023115 [Oedothorax gibbosus]